MKDKKRDILLGKLGPYPFQFVSDQWQPAPFSHLDFDQISILEEYYSKPSTRHFESFLLGVMNSLCY